VRWPRGESRATSAIDVVCIGGEVVECGLRLHGLPEHDDVDHEPGATELVLLAGLIVLA
jgi:hypothetical protein